MSKDNCTALKRAVLYRAHGGIVEVIMPRCKQWSCPACAKANTAEWRARIMDGVDYYQARGVTNWSLMTLTMRDCRGVDSVSAFARRWAKYSTRMRREFLSPRYVTVTERQRDGTLHTHSIISIKGGSVATRWAKDNAAACGLGYMADIKPIEDKKHAIGYVTKYMAKQLDYEWPRGFRRVRTSQGWPGASKCAEEGWIYWGHYYAEGVLYAANEIRRATGLDVRINGFEVEER